MQTHAALATHAQLAAVCGADRRWRMPNKLQPAPCCCWVKTTDKTGGTSIGTCLGYKKVRGDAKLRTRNVRSPHYTNVYELHGVYSQTLLACTDRL